MASGDALVRQLYEAFSRRDHQAMGQCYAPDATFSDPVFRGLSGPQVTGMWRMLCQRATDLRVEFRDVVTDGDRGSAHWEAWYSYGATGRPVHNVIEASFRFRDGRIAEHVDRFDLYRWSRQALGLKGVLLGWTPLVQSAIRKQAGAALQRFLEREAAAPGGP